MHQYKLESGHDMREHLHISGNAFCIYPHGTMHDGTDVTFNIDSTRVGFIPTDPDTCRGEMPRIRVCLLLMGAIRKCTEFRKSGLAWKQTRFAPSMPSKISLRPETSSVSHRQYYYDDSKETLTWQASEHFATGKRGVHEKTQNRVWNKLPH